MRLNFGGTMKKKRQNPESRICKALWQWFQLQYPKQAHRYLRLEVGGSRTKVSQAILKAEGNKAGTSDVLIAMTNKKYGGLWLEVKADKGRMSPNQYQFQKGMESDYLCVTGYGLDECMEIISGYMKSCEQPRDRLQ